jgi:CHAT domain-containing protein
MPEAIFNKEIQLRILSALLLWLCFFNPCAAAAESSAKSMPLNTEQVADAESAALELEKRWDGDSINQAITLYSNIFNYWKNSGDVEKASDCLRKISSLNTLLGKNNEAVTKLTEALQLDGKYDNPAKKVQTLSLIAIAALRLGKAAEAKKFSQQALKISETAAHPDALATTLFAQAQINYDVGEFDLAIKHYEEALDLWKKSGSLKEQAKTLVELSYAYMTNDELLMGLKKAEESFVISNEIDDLRGKSIAKNAIGVMKSKLGKKQEALNIFLASEKQFPNDVDLLEKGGMYNHLAGIYYDFGELPMALNYRLKAFELFEKEQHLFAQLTTLSKLGIITFKLGDENKGLEYFDTGFKLARRANSLYFYSLFAQDLGDLYFENNKLKALTYFKQAEANFEKLKIRTHIALIQSKIGSIYQSQGKNKLARKYFDSALRLNRETKNQLAESQNLYNLAILDAIEKKEEPALKLAEQSIEITESLYSDVVNTKLKTTYFSNVFDRYELYINLLMKMHEQSKNDSYAVQALQAAEKSRARSMLESLALSEANFVKDAESETVKREKEIRVLLNIKADKLTDFLSRNADKAETEKISTEINKLELELEEIKSNLKQSSPVYSAVRNPAPFDVADLQTNFLDENSLLLEFSFGKEQSYLWTVDKTEVNSYVLPPRDQIENRIENLRGLLTSREVKKDEAIEDYQKRIAESENKYWLEARNLSNDLFGQIAGRITNKRLILVPDGKLHYFPVSALPLPNSDQNEPILLTNEIIYEPSAQTLPLLAKNSNQTSERVKNLLVFSDPVFSIDDVRLSAENKAIENLNTETVLSGTTRFVESLNSLPRLTASKDESDSIVNIVGSSKSDIFSGFSANREQFLKAPLADYKIVHLATHGLIDEARPELSGIVFSRFDEAGEKINEFVRLQDIYALNLSADLVVLSACSTGIGKEVKGEGLMSLNNAFLQTGAESVISSFWKVDDYAAVDLMKNFYAALANEKITPSQALRQAQIKMRQNPRYSSPFYWASFNIQGNYRQTPNLLSTGSGNSIYLWIFLLPILLSGIYLWYKSSKTVA